MAATAGSTSAACAAAATATATSAASASGAMPPRTPAASALAATRASICAASAGATRAAVRAATGFRTRGSRATGAERAPRRVHPGCEHPLTRDAVAIHRREADPQLPPGKHLLQVRPQPQDAPAPVHPLHRSTQLGQRGLHPSQLRAGRVPEPKTPPARPFGQAVEAGQVLGAQPAQAQGRRGQQEQDHQQRQQPKQQHSRHWNNPFRVSVGRPFAR